MSYTISVTNTTSDSITVKVRNVPSNAYYARFYIALDDGGAFPFDDFAEDIGSTVTWVFDGYRTVTNGTKYALEPETTYRVKVLLLDMYNNRIDPPAETTATTRPEAFIYYARLILDGNGGSLYSGATEYSVIGTAESEKTYAYVDVEYNCNFVRDGYKFLGYSEDPEARVATYEKQDIYRIRSTSRDANSAPTETLYAVWGSELISVTVGSVTHESVTINVSVSNLSSTEKIYELRAGVFEEGSSNALRGDVSATFAGPSYSTSFKFDRLDFSTTYECVVYIYANYSYTGHSSAISVTTEEKYVDAFIEYPVIQEGASTDEESKVRLKITVYSNDNGNMGRFYLRTQFVPQGAGDFYDTSPTFTLGQNDEYTHIVMFTGLPGNCQYEYYITLYDANGNLLETYEMVGWTNELKRPYQWEWDPIIGQGIMVPTTKISDTEYRAEFITAAEWLAFVENIELVADFCGYTLDTTNLSKAKSGVSRGASMTPLQTNSALYLIDSMNPPEPVPNIVNSGVDRIMAAYFNGLRDSLNSVEMKEE